jgi:hypothetical protein
VDGAIEFAIRVAVRVAAAQKVRSVVLRADEVEVAIPGRRRAGAARLLIRKRARRAAPPPTKGGADLGGFACRSERVACGGAAQEKESHQICGPSACSQKVPIIIDRLRVSPLTSLAAPQEMLEVHGRKVDNGRKHAIAYEND